MSTLIIIALIVAMSFQVVNINLFCKESATYINDSKIKEFKWSRKVVYRVFFYITYLLMLVGIIALYLINITDEMEALKKTIFPIIIITILNIVIKIIINKHYKKIRREITIEEAKIIEEKSKKSFLIYDLTMLAFTITIIVILLGNEVSQKEPFKCEKQMIEINYENNSFNFPMEEVVEFSKIKQIDTIREAQALLDEKQNDKTKNFICINNNESELIGEVRQYLYLETKTDCFMIGFASRQELEYRYGQLQTENNALLEKMNEEFKEDIEKRK